MIALFFCGCADDDTQAVDQGSDTLGDLVTPRDQGREGDSISADVAADVVAVDLAELDFAPGFDGDVGPCPGQPMITLERLTSCVSEREQAEIEVIARDPCGAPLRLSWQKSGDEGQLLTEPGKAILRLTPGADHPCPYRIRARVEAGSRVVERTFEIWVRRSGDTNRDGLVDARDLLVWQAEMLRVDCCDRRTPCAADVDGNCAVNRADHALIVQQLATVGCTCP